MEKRSKDHAQEARPYYWKPAYPSTQERLKWIINFIQQDLPSPDPAKLMETSIQMEKYLFLRELTHEKLDFDPFIPAVNQFSFSDEPVNISDMLSQTYLEEMNDIRLSISKFFFEYIWPVIEINQRFFELEDEIEKIPKEKRSDEDYKPLLEVLKDYRQNLIKTHNYRATSRIMVDPFRRHLLIITEESLMGGREDRAVLELNGLLSDLDLYGIRKCRGCNRFFYNPTKKKKIFCNSKCNWRFNARKKREKNPEAYKEKQREIMWQRYEEQIKGKIGKNVTVKRRKHYKIRPKKKGGDN